MLHPNAELVAQHWLKTLPGIPTNSVAMTLPEDNSSWSASGFVQVAAVVGGSSELYYAFRKPVLQINCYATNPNSDKPPWHRANQLAETIFQAQYDEDLVKADLSTIPAAYNQARVIEVSATEPTKLEGDDASYAIFMTNLQMHWVEL